MSGLVFKALDFFLESQFFLFQASKRYIVRTWPRRLVHYFLVKNAVFFSEFCKMTFKRHPSSSVRGFMTSPAWQMIFMLSIGHGRTFLPNL